LWKCLNIPPERDLVDVAVYSSIFLHLRDPFLALQSGLKNTRENVIVTEPLRGLVGPTIEPYMGFLPDSQPQEPKGTWWNLRPELIVRMIGVLGFEETSITYHTQLYEGQEITVYTVVGRRTHGPQLRITEAGTFSRFLRSRQLMAAQLLCSWRMSTPSSVNA
jgi:hypothetical protein